MRMGPPDPHRAAGRAGLRPSARALVCFKDAREAARVLADALPVLKAMTRVNVVEIVEGGGGEQAERRLGKCRRRGSSATGSRRIAPRPVTDGSLAEKLNAVDARPWDAWTSSSSGAFGHKPPAANGPFGGVDAATFFLRGERCVLASH